ncbi:MAG: fatty acyl-AMP ligase [bacterium]|nr:fatty acyl-AMP ligase [bacterium]
MAELHRPGVECRSLVEAMQRHLAERAAKPVLTFLEDGENEAGTFTYGELDHRVRALAAVLQERGMVGERALLLFPSGLEFVVAFMGCLFAGVVAVPVPVPSAGRKAARERLSSVYRHARPRVVLTNAAIRSALAPLVAEISELRLHWICSDEIEEDGAAAWRDPGIDRDSLALLQYTSGSTAKPRGVMISHGNLVHNAETIRQAFDHAPDTAMVSWLPLHHDMGLIGMLLQPLYVGMLSVLMPPLLFIQRPHRWLQAISRYRAHTSGGPNFGYDLCIRKLTPQQCEGLDLSCWRVAFNGAEPVRAATLQRFAEKFRPFGFRPASCYPCYGLAEATLFVSGGHPDEPPVIRTFDRAALNRDRVVAVAEEGEGLTLAGSGRPWLDQQTVIADPWTGERCPPDRIGEIWLAGGNSGQGYWELPRESEELFAARLTGEPQAGPYLRTGDLGFLHEGELFVTGRIKDLIIIAGQNHYPQDIEQTVEDHHPNVRRGCCAAFSVDLEEEERLVVVAELRWGGEVAEIVRSIRRSVAEEHDLRVHAVELCQPGTIPRTTSGKIRRRGCRSAFLAGELAGLEEAGGGV